tara:strand:- start:668 stop:832 length:165 start_codon:yes stop_codon:yes gene_type:complete
MRALLTICLLRLEKLEWKRALFGALSAIAFSLDVYFVDNKLATKDKKEVSIGSL